MLGLKILRRVLIKEEVPIFNLQLTITGWQGPFRDYNEFRHVVDRFNQLVDSSTMSYRVLEDGRLVPGSRKGLHTHFSEIDLTESSLHIHYFRGGVEPIVRGGDSVFLSDEKEHYEAFFKQKPIYTLSGLYATLSDNKINTKIRRLEEELKEHKGYEFNSIAIHKRTKVKLLENAYRRKISNQ